MVRKENGMGVMCTTLSAKTVRTMSGLAILDDEEYGQL
jgi:hypothetical protein